MKFRLRPILDEMNTFYSKPASADRFNEYLAKLEGGTKGNLKLPIGGYNPMAKPQIVQKIQELQEMAAEEVMGDVISELNRKFSDSGDQKVMVVLNLADDLKGGWTNRHSTDFDSKFKLNGLVSRNFSTPFFWSSEEYNESLIRTRTIEYARRTIYWLENTRIKSLEDHVKQELFVLGGDGESNFTAEVHEVVKLHEFYEQHKDEEDYSLIFNFFYGDEVSASLSYPVYGVGGVNGFDYVRALAMNR